MLQEGSEMGSGGEGVGCADKNIYGDEREDGATIDRYCCQGCHKLKFSGDCST